MKRATVLSLCLSFVVCGAALSSSAYAQAAADQSALLSQARHSYYGMSNEGLAAFQCHIEPDWNALLADQRKTNPKGADQAIATLNQLFFTVRFSPEGKVTLTHSDLTGQNQQMMDAMAQIYGGMEQMTSGFFDTWKMFVFSPPFPEIASNYRLEAVGPKYRLSYREA